MKPPVSRHPDTVRRRILDAAQAEFMAHGYEAASTNRITDGFGGSKATLFRHYASKEALLGAVVQRIAMQWERALDWRSIPQGAPLEWLEAVGVRTLGWILGDEPIFIGRLAIAEGHKFPALEQTFEETAARPIRTMIATRLRRWTRAGLLDCAQPLADAQHWIDLVVSGAVSRRLYGAPRPTDARLRAHVRRAVELFIEGAGATRGRPARRPPAPAGASAGGGRARRRRRP